MSGVHGLFLAVLRSVGEETERCQGNVNVTHQNPAMEEPIVQGTLRKQKQRSVTQIHVQVLVHLQRRLEMITLIRESTQNCKKMFASFS